MVFYGGYDGLCDYFVNECLDGSSIRFEDMLSWIFKVDVIFIFFDFC